MAGRPAYNLRRTTAPSNEPIEKSSAKLNANIETTETFWDNWFDGAGDAAGAIPTARAMVEHDAQVVMMPQVWQLRLDAWPDDDWIDLMIHPVQSVTVTYEDLNDATQTWAASNYELQVNKFRSILMKTDKDVDFPDLSTGDPRPVTIAITAGYSNTTSQPTVAAQRALVPPQLKHAMLMLTTHWFENRSSILVGTISREIEQGYMSLIHSIRPARYV